MSAPHLNMIFADYGVPASLRHPLIKTLKGRGVKREMSLCDRAGLEVPRGPVAKERD
jgi:hypothetical protein